MVGEVVAMKVLESIHEMIEEIEEEYQILRDLGNHPNIPRFHGIYLNPPTSGLNAEIWMAMEVSLSGRHVIGGLHLVKDLLLHKNLSVCTQIPVAMLYSSASLLHKSLSVRLS